MSIIYDETSGKRKVSTKTVGSTTYGISIADLQSITGSSKRDLMLLHCESQNGVGTSSTDYSEDEYIYNDSGTKIRSAFALGDDTTGMPIPASWHRHFNDGRTKGDLVISDDGSRVAQPRWNLWADHVNFGKFALKDGSNNYHLQYNIFCPFNKHPLKNDGTPVFNNGMGAPNLEQWQDFCDTESHEPRFDITDNIKAFEFHNGVYAPLSSKSKMAIGSLASVRDECQVWVDPREEVADAYCALGNIVDWDSTSHSTRLATKSGKNYIFDSNGLEIYGMSVEMTEAGTASNPLTIARANMSTSTALKKGNVEKETYQNGMIISLEYACDYGNALYKKMKSFGGTLPAYITLGAIIAPNINNREKLTSSQVATCDRVVGKKFLNVESTFDVAYNGAQKKTRTIFTRDTIGNYKFGIAVNVSNERFIKENVSGRQGGFGSYMFVYDTSTGNYVTGSHNFGALVEITTVDANANDYTHYSRHIVDLVPFDEVYGTNTSSWENVEGSPWQGLNYNGKTLPSAYTNAYLLQVKNTALELSSLSENSTIVVTLYDKTKEVPYDVFANGLYSTGAKARAIVQSTSTLGYLYWLKSRYTNNQPIVDLMGNTSVRVTKWYDFIRYNASGTEIQQNLSDFYSKKVRIYNGMGNNDYKEATFPSNSTTVNLTGWHSEQITLSLSWGDIRSIADKNGTFAISANVYTLMVSNLECRAGDIYRVQILG